MPDHLRRVLCATALLLGATLPASAQARISLDVRDLDLYDAVRLLSTEAGVNTVVDSSVPHRPVTIRLTNVTFAEALATLAQANDLETARVGGVIYLAMADVMNRRYPSGRTGSQTAVFSAAGADPIDLTKALADALPHGTIVSMDKRTGKVVITGSATSLRRARELVTTFSARSTVVQSAIPMRYAKAAEALKALQTVLPNGGSANSFASDQQNEIVISGPPEYVTQASAIIEKVDKPGQQVRYDVAVTDISPSSASNVGISYGGYTGSATSPTISPNQLTTTFTTKSFPFAATLNALVASNQAKVLARPTLATLNNVQATLLVGQQYPIVYFDARTGTQQVQFVNIGVNLMVTPTIGSDGSITTNLETDYSQFGGSIAQFPIINTRKAQSTLRVQNGETIVIAGLFEDIDAKSVSKIPFLGDIPFIGEVFKTRTSQHTRDEIVFLITPHIVSDSDPYKAKPPVGVETQ